MSMSCTTTKTLNAINLPCPMCGEEEAGIQINLDYLHDDDAQFHCRNCDSEFGRNRIEAIVRKWSKMLTWLDAAPDVDGE